MGRSRPGVALLDMEAQWLHRNPHSNPPLANRSRRRANHRICAGGAWPHGRDCASALAHLRSLLAFFELGTHEAVCAVED